MHHYIDQWRHADVAAAVAAAVEIAAVIEAQMQNYLPRKSPASNDLD